MKRLLIATFLLLISFYLSSQVVYKGQVWPKNENEGYGSDTIEVIMIRNADGLGKAGFIMLIDTGISRDTGYIVLDANGLHISPIDTLEFSDGSIQTTGLIAYLAGRNVFTDLNTFQDTIKQVMNSDSIQMWQDGTYGNIKSSNDIRIDNNVGINKNPSTYALDVNGNASFSGYIITGATSAAVLGDGFLYFNSAVKGNITYAGSNNWTFNKMKLSILNLGYSYDMFYCSNDLDADKDSAVIINNRGYFITDSAVSFKKSRFFTDDESFSLPAKDGYATVRAIGSNDYLQVLFNSDGSVVQLVASGNTATTDSDGNLCIFDDGANAVIRNRLNASKTLIIDITHQK